MSIFDANWNASDAISYLLALEAAMGAENNEKGAQIIEHAMVDFHGHFGDVDAVLRIFDESDGFFGHFGDILSVRAAFDAIFERARTVAAINCLFPALLKQKPAEPAKTIIAL